jgi:hypothetical protein
MRQTISGCLIAAAVCTSIAPLPFVQECALYILPLQYLFWIGFGLGFAAIAQFLFDRVFSGPYRYVERGIPLVVRIWSVDLRVVQTINGTPVYRYFAVLEYRDPESGDLRVSEVSTRELSQFHVSIGLATTYRAGDYASAVYFPGKLAKSLRLYGFLELKPGLGLIRTEPSQAWTGRQNALLGLGVFVVLVACLWVIYTLSKYVPLSADPFQVIVVIVAGAVVPGFGFVAWRRLKKRREPTLKEVAPPPTKAGGGQFPALGGFEPYFSTGMVFVVGAILTFCTGATMNALLDDSPPVSRPVQIDRMVSVTHYFILREYKIQYHFLDDQAHAHIVSTPAEMAEFRGPLATAEIHSGRFGWSWVKALHPPAN